MINKIRYGLNSLMANKGFIKYLANTSWLFAEQILRMISGLLVGIYVARFLGPEKFGIFSYALAFVALFGSFAKLGLDGIIVRDLINSSEGRDRYLGTAFWLKIIGALATGLGILAIVTFTENDITTKTFIGIISAGLIFQSFEVIEFYFHSRVLSKYVSICKILQLITSSLLKLFFIATDAELFWFVLVSLIDQVSLAAALSYAYFKQKLGGFYLNFDIGLAKQLLHCAKPFIISGIMVSIYSSIDRLIIKEMLGAKEVGLYVAATGLINALYFAPTIIANSLFPAILNAKRQSETLYTKRLSTLYKYTITAAAITCVLIFIFSEQIINILYGPKYSSSSSVLKIYVWNFIPISFSTVFGKWLLAENFQYLIPRFVFMAIIANVAGCYIFIPLWSIEGAALAALAAQFIPLIYYGISNKAVNSQLKSIFNHQR